MNTSAIRFRAYEARTQSVTRTVSAVMAGVRDWRLRRRVAADLWAMDDSVLSDIGIGTGDIPALVDDLVSASKRHDGGLTT